MTKNRIQNTTRLVHENPLAAIIEYGGGGGIEQSEARGQRELLASEVLPTDTRDEAAFLALGFTFGGPVEGDEMFRAATLPTGWKREGSNHAMWSYIVDERGIRRVSVFYKAAFYDRSAHMGLTNVGYAIGSDALYGDETPTADTMRLALLTTDEKAEVRYALDRMRENIAETPSVYGKYATRLAEADAILAAHS
jgi:hypothetical protein